ncbi:MAG: hypothetical protein CVV47_14465 [Spirochaetae bacterium HGW-Spirochaetae-3]|jgi:hypothetical protein|nr:MAG: hypothetical protein CVV47_14465 [Spirochaetae bacterium HGW-Spirochaetae-3]
MSDEIDPEIAALIGGGVEEYSMKPAAHKPAADGPSFEALFGGMSVSGELEAKGEFEVDLAKKAYEPVARFESDPPNTFFDDPQYYQKALAGEGEGSLRFHELLKKYLQATDPKDRGMYRQQVITAYWNMVSHMIPRVVANNPVIPKQLMVRFGLALPTMIGPEQRSLFSRIIHQKTSAEPVYYLDEWLRHVAMGQINPSSTDEVSQARGDERARFNTLLQKAMGKRDTAEAFLKAKAEERKTLEGMIRDRVDIVCEHGGMPGFYQVPAPYNDGQKKTITELGEILRRLLAADKELVSSAEAFEEATKDVQTVKDKVGSLGEDTKANLQALSQEFDTARQMLKMCSGRQGNHFPLVTKEYFHLNLREIGTRENVLDALAWLESIDTQAYCRPYKSALNRIEPYIILLPSYGDTGVCWEPFDRYNRHTSRARIAVPMYPKNLRIAIAIAVADMRWQAAKEKASYYWMEEGITGQYYQWFVKQKLKGDVKEFFIQDYIIWLTKESDGIQKLDKEVRGIFWRLIPFSQPIKDKLRDRSFVYQELYQRDVNKSLSDGY